MGNIYKFFSKIICYVLFVLIVLGGSLFIKNKFYNQSEQPAVNLLFEDNQATDTLVRLLGLTGIRIQHDRLSSEPDWPEAKLTLKSRHLNEITRGVQGKIEADISWLIPSNQERWQSKGLKYLQFSKTQANTILNLVFNDLKLGHKIMPLQTHYTGILFLGSTLQNVRERLKFLNKCVEKKMFSFEKVWILTGERALDPAIGETPENLLDPKGAIALRADWKKLPNAHFPRDEGHMIEWVFQQSCSEHIPLSQVETIYAEKETGRVRATTKTTVETWLKHNPRGGTYLAVSSQPFSLYQLLVLRHHVLANGRPDIQIEVIGAKFPAHLYTNQSEEKLQQTVGIALDNIAKICYELTEVEKLKVAGT